MKRIFILLLLAGILFAEERLQITIGESKIIPVDAPKKIAVGNPLIADVKVVSEKEFLLIGKSGGTTSLIVWDKDNNQVTSQVVVLAANLEKTMIEVNAQVLEIRKDSNTVFGVNWDAALSALELSEKTLPPLFQVGDFERLKKVQVKIDALIKNGYAKVLAKPRLLTISGFKAKFLSGGEIPVMIQNGGQSDSSIHIDWKTYGVKLDIEPTSDVLDNINCVIRVEVSNLDFSAGVSYNGSVVPALKTRWADTSLYVKKGGTIVIGGLIQDTQTEDVYKVPLLGDIPLLGAVFRKKTTVRSRKELLIFVTPRTIED